MTPRQHWDPRPATRDDLPDEFTPETLRALDLRTLRQLSRHGNGVLSADEQQQFDTALADLRRGTISLVEDSLRRASHGGPDNLDPQLRRSYQRTQQRLAEQARRIQDSLPAAGPAEESPDAPPGGDTSGGDSAGSLEEEVEQTSETLDILEKIASLQQQQLEHQESQLLSETRGLFFAFVVSVAVIIAGVAPLVEAEPHERWLTVIWTVAVTVLAGLVYGLVRAVQARR